MGMCLLVVADADVDAFALEKSRKGTDVGITVVVREEDTRLHRLGSTNELVGCHGVRLVAWKEGDVDVPQVRHLFDVLGVASDVDAETVDGEHIAVVTSFGMELEMPFGVVVGRYGFHADAVGYLLAVAVLHDFACTEHVGTALVGNESRLGTAEGGEGALIEVVAMLMGDKDVVGLRHGRIVDDFLSHLADGVNLYFLAVVLDADAGMDEAVELDFLATGCAEHIDGVRTFLIGGGSGLACGDVLACTLPGFDASLEVDDLVAGLIELLGCIGTTAATAAIDGYGFRLVEKPCGIGHEVALLHVGMETLTTVAARDESLGKLFGCPHVEQLDVLLFDALGEFIYAQILDVALCASSDVKPC